MDTHSSLLSAATSSTLRHFYMAIALSIFPLCALLGTPLLGALSDRFGRKKILSLCLLGSFWGYSISALGIFVNSFAVFLIGRMLAGATFGSQPIAQAAIADANSLQHKALNMSLISFAMTLSITLGPLLGGYLTDPSISPYFNNTTPFIVAAILALLNAIWLWLAYVDADQPRAQAHLGHLLRELKLLWQVALVKRLLVVFFLLEIGWSFYFQSVGLLLQDWYHFSSVQIGNFLSYSGLWMCFGLLVLFRWLYKVMSLQMIAKGFLGLAFIGLIFCATATHAHQQWLGVILVAIAVGIAYTALVTLLSNAMAVTLQGRVMGVAGSLLTGAWMLTGFLGPLLAVKNVALPFYCAVLAFALGIILILIKLPVLLRQPCSESE